MSERIVVSHVYNLLFVFRKIFRLQYLTAVLIIGLTAQICLGKESFQQVDPLILHESTQLDTTTVYGLDPKFEAGNHVISTDSAMYYDTDIQGLMRCDNRRILVHPLSHISIPEGTQITLPISLYYNCTPTSDVTVTISDVSSHHPSMRRTPENLVFSDFSSTHHPVNKNFTVTAGRGDYSVNHTFDLQLTASGGGFDATNVVTIYVGPDADVQNECEPAEQSPCLYLRPNNPYSVSRLGQNYYISKITEGKREQVLVRLSRPPSDDVSVGLSMDYNHTINFGLHSGPYSTSPIADTLTFTPDNWYDEQSVWLIAKSNRQIDHDSPPVTIKLTPSGGGFSNANDGIISIRSITDNGRHMIFADPLSLSVQEGSSFSFKVWLSHRPLDDVDVNIGWEGKPIQEVTWSSSEMTFRVDNYSDDQWITVSAASDNNTENEQGTILLSAKNGGYNGRTLKIPIEVIDDGLGGAEILVEPSEITFLEGEAPAKAFQVKLSQPPTGAVDVRIHENPLVDIGNAFQGGDPNLVNPNIAKVLNFDAQNWSDFQPVSAIFLEDSDRIDNESTLVLTGHAVEYDGTRTEVPITKIDDDKLIYPADPIIVPEGGTNEKDFKIFLAGRPTGPVEISISGDENTDLSLSSDLLTFTPQSFDSNDTTTVILSAKEDEDSIDDPITLTLTATGANYETLTGIVQIRIEDNDVDGAIEAPKTLTVTEGDTQDLQIKLSAVPLGEVQVAISGQSGTDLSVSVSSLTFTVANYDDAQTITLTAAEEADADEDYANDTVDLTLSGTGGGYDTTHVVVVVINDNDINGEIMAPSPITITEGTPSRELKVRLSLPPLEPVTVTVNQQTSSNLNAPDPPTINFDASNYDDPVAVTLMADPDDNLINRLSETLTLTASGGGYDGVDTTITVNFEDPDKPEITSPSSLTILEGQTIPLSISLSNQPSADVEVTITGTAGTDLSSNTTTLTFTDDTWNINKEVTLDAGEDDDTVDDPITLTLTASNGGYNGVTKDVKVTIDDDDGPISTPSVSLSVHPNPVTEGNTTRLTVTLSEAVSTPTVLELEYEDIDTEPNDYTELPSLTIAAGALSTTGYLRIDDDEISEPDESFRIRLVKPEGVDLGTPSFVDVTILDNDTAPPTEVILTVDRQSVTEGESVTVTVTLNDALDQAVTIPLDYPTDGASAEANLDYTPLPELTIAAGRTTQSGTIETLTDALQEGEEIFTVALGALPPQVVGGRMLSHTITIVDQIQPPEVSLSVDRNPVDEGEITTITVTLSGPLSDDVSIPVTLTYQTASSEDLDVLTSLSPVIASGDTETDISLRTVDDDLIEGSETFTVALGSLPTTVVEGSPSTLEITINDTDEARLDAPASVIIPEGDQKTIEVSLTAVPSGQVSVEITGYEGTDLSVSLSELIFSPDRWDQPQELTLTAGQDDDFLPDEVSLRMTASGGEYSGVTHTLEVTIIDGNQPGLVVQSSVLINEGGEESFDVRLAQQPTDAVTVLISGTTGTDLVLQSPSILNFSVFNWDQNQSVDLIAEEDSDADADPPIQLILNASGGGYDGISETVTVTIQEKDQIDMVVEPTSLRIAEGESDALSVYLTAQPSANVTVDISGYETSDLMIPRPSLTFTPSEWQISNEFALEAGTDLDTDNDEITLTIRATGGGYSGQQEEVQVTIVDQGLPKITIYDAQAKEDDGIIRLPLELSHTTDQVVTVQYSSTDETATAPEDYTSSRGIVIFDPGGTRGIVQFEILPDARVEVTKTFTVTLTGATNAEIVRSSATATIIDDDGGVPTIAIYDAVGSDDAGLMTFEVVLSKPSPHAITVGYRTEDGSAIAGEDYAGSSGQVTFARGEMQKTIEVLLLSKDINWQEETFFVHLEASESVQIEKDVATAVIQQPTQAQENALTAYTARFVRTLSVQLTEALQERLQPSGSTCSAMERAETAQLWHGTSNWSPSLGELLSGCRISRMDTTSFGRMGFWGRGSFRRFHGRDTDALTLRGDVSTAMMGTDYRWNTGWMAGMMIAYSQGSGTYQHSDEDGEISTQLTGIYPYVSYAASDWEIWMSGGYGWGSAELQDINRDVASRFGAVGFQGDLASVRTSRLRYYGDVLLTDADIEEHQSEVIRVRLGMESAFHISEWIHPYVEANVRQDGGDAETGISLELGGGLRVAYPEWKLHGEVRSQGLVLHSADGFMEWGISGSIQIGHPSEGLMMRVRPSWGPNHRMSLYRQQTILDTSPLRSATHRTEVELGYGIPVHDGTVRSIVGVTQLPQGRLLRVGGQLNPWDWVSFTISGLAHQHQSTVGDMSVHVQSTLQY